MSLFREINSFALNHVLLLLIGLWILCLHLQTKNSGLKINLCLKCKYSWPQISDTALRAECASLARNDFSIMELFKEI